MRQQKTALKLFNCNTLIFYGYENLLPLYFMVVSNRVKLIFLSHATQNHAHKSQILAQVHVIKTTLSTDGVFRPYNPIISTNNPYLQLLKGKSTATSNFSVVLDSGASNNRPQKTSNRAWGNVTGFLLTSGVPPLLSCRLVEPGSYHRLPILMEVAIRYYVVSFGRHDC
jgi:hypothetical protein